MPWRLRFSALQFFKNNNVRSVQFLLAMTLKPHCASWNCWKAGRLRHYGLHQMRVVMQQYGVYVDLMTCCTAWDTLKVNNSLDLLPLLQ